MLLCHAIVCEINTLLYYIYTRELKEPIPKKNRPVKTDNIKPQHFIPSKDFETIMRGGVVDFFK